MDDLISRQAAIDALDKRFDDVPMELTTEILQLRHDLRERIPSAQPATNCSEIPNSSDDTISRQAAIEALARMMPRSYTPDGSHPADEEIFKAQEIYVDCIESIEILPAVQPEIIHCKDCKHWRDDHTCHEHSLVSPMCANEYCSRAERRTDERFDRQTGGD